MSKRGSSNRRVVKVPPLVQKLRDERLAQTIASERGRPAGGAGFIMCHRAIGTQIGEAQRRGEA